MKQMPVLALFAIIAGTAAVYAGVCIVDEGVPCSSPQYGTMKQGWGACPLCHGLNYELLGVPYTPYKHSADWEANSGWNDYVETTNSCSVDVSDSLYCQNCGVWVTISFEIDGTPERMVFPDTSSYICNP